MRDASMWFYKQVKSFFSLLSNRWPSSSSSLTFVAVTSPLRHSHTYANAREGEWASKCDLRSADKERTPFRAYQRPNTSYAPHCKCKHDRIYSSFIFIRWSSPFSALFLVSNRNMQANPPKRNVDSVVATQVNIQYEHSILRIAHIFRVTQCIRYSAKLGEEWNVWRALDIFFSWVNRERSSKRLVFRMKLQYLYELLI